MGGILLGSQKSSPLTANSTPDSTPSSTEKKGFNKAVIVRLIIIAIAAGIIIYFVFFRPKRISARIPTSKDIKNVLGYEWQNISGDPTLISTLTALREFETAAPEYYKQIGDICDELVKLDISTFDPNFDAKLSYDWRTYQYVLQVQKSLQEWSRKISSTKLISKSRDKAERKGPVDVRSKVYESILRPTVLKTRYNMTDFEKYADQLDTIVDNYRQNIRTGMHYRRLHSGGPSRNEEK